MSCRTIIYKGLLLADQVGKYYLDLQDPRVSALALVHSVSRPTPSRMAAGAPVPHGRAQRRDQHRQGNFNWMRAREGVMKSPLLGDDLQKLYPISMEGQSDSAPSTTRSNC